MTYRVVPFVANLTTGQNAGSAAEQLARLINGQVNEGYQYVRLENIEVRVTDPGTNGCFGIGAVPPRTDITRFDMAVFVKS